MKTADKIHEIFDVSQFEETVAAYDFVNLLAQVVDGANELKYPLEMSGIFMDLWQNYVRMCQAQHRALMKTILGEETYERFVAHQDCPDIACKVMDRIEKTCGEIHVGTDLSKVDVNDILKEYGLT